MSDQVPSSILPDLQASQAQRSNAELLEQLIKSEGESPPQAGRPPAAHKPYLRVIVAAVLILAIALSLWPGLLTWQAALPEMTDEALTFFQYVQGLQPGAPVLVAVDYQPALTGEMEAVASPVLEHLAIQGAYLALVSTVPSGPIQGQRLIDEVNHKLDYPYFTADTYTNLGYIPGGATGLRSFTEAPRETFPQPLSGDPGWQAASLQNVFALSNFYQLIVITDNPDTARAWIEQANHWRGGPPLLMVLSAQAAPLVRPYFEANPQRVQGLVSGMAGGAAYETLASSSASNPSTWTAFNIGLLAAIALILVGGIYSAFQTRKPGQGDQPAGEASG